MCPEQPSPAAAPGPVPAVLDGVLFDSASGEIIAEAEEEAPEDEVMAAAMALIAALESQDPEAATGDLIALAPEDAPPRGEG